MMRNRPISMIQLLENTVHSLLEAGKGMEALPLCERAASLRCDHFGTSSREASAGFEKCVTVAVTVAKAYMSAGEHGHARSVLSRAQSLLQRTTSRNLESVKLRLETYNSCSCCCKLNSDFAAALGGCGGVGGI